MLSFNQNGDFSKTLKFLEKEKNAVNLLDLDKYGKEGVAALSSVTPVKTGKTANSWEYKIERKGGFISISWSNTNIVDGVNVAIILQYGHGTRQGGYVRGINYINPALRPIFDKMAESAWKEVTKI